MISSLILGGTKGLGKALAVQSLAMGYDTTVVGRTAERCGDAALRGARFVKVDLSRLTDNDVQEHWWMSEATHIFWVAGIFLRKPLTDCTSEEVNRMTDTHFVGPARLLAAIHRVKKLARPLADEPGDPYHLITVGSTSSWRVRDNETVYAALKAAKAHFTRNFAREMARDLPGSRATLVNPGGMRTPDFWDGSGQDIGSFMNPDDVASIIWSRVQAQQAPYDEYSVMRNADGSPQIREGIQMTESPF
jgi:NAD(P)-dependent dehydrogenase (short-subunit alcohol dehydrogenase family)